MNSSPSDDRPERESILVIRLSSLGDVLLTAPTIRSLRKRFPQAEIDFLVAREYRDVVTLIPGVDRILEFDKRGGWGELLRVRREISRRYSLIVDLQNSPRSAFLRAFAFPAIWVKAKRYRLRRWLLVRFKWNRYQRVFPVAERYLEAVETIGGEDDGLGLELYAQAQLYGDDKHEGAAKAVVLCPGAMHATKRWPDENWVELARSLKIDGLHVTIVGANAERAQIETISQSAGVRCVTDLTIPDVAGLFIDADVVVSNDSGLMHLATGLGRPVVAIFGPTVKEFGFMPFRGNSIVLENELDCRPCSAMGSASCPKGHFKCMKLTTTERVRQAVYSVIVAAK